MENTPPNTDPQTGTAEVVAKSTEVVQRAAQAIANSGPTVAQKVVDVLATREIEKRANTLVTGLDKLTKLRGDARKIKPDQLAYGADCKPVGEGTYSKAKAEELKKANEAIDKLQAALDLALSDKADFSKLYNLVNSSSGTSEAAE